MVDIVISIVSVILTAIFTAYLTSRRMRIKNQLQGIVEDTAETFKAALAEAGSNNELLNTIKSLQNQNVEIMKQLQELQNKKI